MSDILNLVLHLDTQLAPFIAQYGTWIYSVLFIIIFSETGLIVFPFLPGDSLLFVAGAAAAEGAIDAYLLGLLLFVAAVLGNTVNFLIGRFLGQSWLHSESSGIGRLIDRRAITKTQLFYQKHGGKAVVIARFLPVFRTFVPFVAGLANMPAVRFQQCNILGAGLWIFGLIASGYWFGHLPFIRSHLNLIVLIGILSALVPVLFALAWRLIQPKNNG